jgi:hypothetical protein
LTDYRRRNFLTAKNIARRSRSQTIKDNFHHEGGAKDTKEEFSRKGAKALSFRPKGEIFPSSLPALGMTDLGPSLGVPFDPALDMLGVLSTLLKTGLARANPRFG